MQRLAAQNGGPKCNARTKPFGNQTVARSRGLGYTRFTMSTWVIISWVLVAILTGLNAFIFLKLKAASEQMLQMAFPGSKDMGEAMQKMQQTMAAMQRAGSRGPGRPAMPTLPGGGKNMDAQLR